MNPETVKKVLIFRIGQLGDTLVSVPAMWAVRNYFKGARITLLSDEHPDSGYVRASDVLDGSGIVDDFLSYHFIKPKKGFLNQSWKMLGLLRELRSKKYDAMVYLAPSQRSKSQIYRDRLFYNLAGIKRFFGFNGFQHFPKKVPGQSLPAIQQEGDLLLQRLCESGIEAPEVGKGRVDINIGEQEIKAVERWQVNLPPDGDRTWIAVGPGSKMPVKVWPTERYAEVVQRLIGEFDIWPIVFGGYDDKELGQFLIRQWARGYNAAGILGVREGIAALEKCVLYVGNDTGVMHMAAAAGMPCVGIYSARDYPGHWYPYGNGHIVFRNRPECEGCMLQVCSKQKAECIMSISVDDVFQACSSILSNKLAVEVH